MVRKLLVDLAERTVATYAVTFIGLLIASSTSTVDVSTARAAAVAAIPAALSVVKGFLATFVGDPSSASLTIPRNADDLNTGVPFVFTKDQE